MRRRRAFQAETLAELESRVVLSHAGIAGASAHVAAFVPGSRAPGRPVAPVPAGINAAFDSFQQDYTQARGVYLSVLTSPTTGSTETAASNANLVAAFGNYTHSRVNLLAQQLTGLFVQATAGGQTHQHQQLAQGPGTNFYRVVQTRVNGLDTMQNATANSFRVGSLGRSLIDSTPTSNQGSGTIALDSLAQDQSIEASRLAVINGYSFYKTLSSGHNGKK